MVEMLQNISKHTNEVDEDKRNRGIFLLSKKDNEFIVTSGNFIDIKTADSFPEKIEYLNGLDSDGLHNLYDSILLQADTATEQKTGLGLIDIRMKSEKKLLYKISQVDYKHFFLTLQTSISDLE